MRLVSWNIQQGGGTRVDRICARLEGWKPDICVLVEYCNTESSQAIRNYLHQQLGLTYMQETLMPGDSHRVYGLLVASRWQLTTIESLLPGAIPQRWRLLRVGGETPSLTLGAAYVPNRGEDAGDKCDYLESLVTFTRDWPYGPGIIVGDFNTGRKAVDEEAPYFVDFEERFMVGMEQSGWADAFRVFHPDDRRYSWWNNFQGKRTGFLLDHAFVNPALAPVLIDCNLVHDEQDWPSDHSALIIDLSY